MQYLFKSVLINILFLFTIYTTAFAEQAHKEHDHNQATKHTKQHEQQPSSEHAHDHAEEEQAGVELSSRQRALANIKVQALYPRIMYYQIYAPGEIKANAYSSYLVSPRVDSVVLRRHVTLGEQVKKGKPLVTLFSDTVAEAQAAFQVAKAEWQRVKKLGRKVVSDKRFIAAQTEYNATYGRLLAFGLSQHSIKTLSNKKNQVLGEYTLTAAINGAVLSDDFHQGQRVEAGEALITLADESQLWVEARLSPTPPLTLAAGNQAQVKVGKETFTAKVIQEAHTIDPQTRTRVVRLAINNAAHHLHPGLFAEVYFNFSSDTAVMAVPESALMRSPDGDWTVFIKTETQQFTAQEIELGKNFGKWQEIKGLPTGSNVVMEGAFFVASEIAKGGFDPHNH